MKVIASILLSLSCGVRAWSYQGHLLSAGVAHCILENTSPQVLQEAEDILHHLHNEQTVHERDHVFVESALFADVIKRNGGQFQETWHFNDAPLAKETKRKLFLAFEPYEVISYARISEHVKSQPLTVTSALQQSYQALFCLNRGCSPVNEVYTAVASHYSNDTQEIESVLLRLVIHYAGDISQPLHNADRGDRGGNGFPLKLHYGVDNLHALWDTAVYRYHNTSNTPFSESDWQLFETVACRLSDQFSFDPSEYQWSLESAQSWTEGSFKEAQQAYQGLQPGEAVPLAYILKHQTLAQRKIALAGYRIASILSSIYA